MPVMEFVGRVIDLFNEHRAAAAQPALRRPRLVSPRAWRPLHWWLAQRHRGRPRHLLNAFNAYRPYIATEKRFVAASTRRLLEGKVPYPRIESYLLRVADYAVTREWGKDVSWDPSLLVSSGDLPTTPA